MNRNVLLGGGAVLLVLALFAFSLYVPSPQTGSDTTLRPVTFVTDWKAQAEQGGFYQALAKGYYADAGLDVSIRQGGPGINVPQLLASNSVDFGMGSNSFIPLNIVAAGAGAKAVMASFQKDPQVLITHPRDDVKSLEDMAGKPIMVSDATISAFWVWLRSRFGFTDDQIRKYTFNLAPFLTDPTAIQQGYLSSEPYLIEKEAGFKPQVFLLADHGYPGYATFILANNQMIADDPALVQAFVDATIKGWYSYLYGDPAPGNALILADNPEMRDDVLAQAIAKLRAYGVADSGDALTDGIGAMSEARWKTFFDVMAANGVYEPGLDWKQAFTLQFVNKGVGLDMKRELGTE
ncbi:MAG: ABC transporter substrate-binding protein [Alphaproteobacteria bacterium]|nr:ABC transporter substrate-binding protein [Alphaproteobacteria bacterium]MBO6628899.1 ABC transporter substrate-binding protein [Alphaproteobacteria bacterium]